MKQPIFTSLVCLVLVSQAQAQGTAFTYQGNLFESGLPANGAHDFEFRLFNAASGGVQVGPVVTVADAPVTAGSFAATLDFGASFSGADRWLQISVRSGASTGAHTTLSPRQPITATPYAIRSANAASAENVSGPVSAAQLTGTISPARIGVGTITGAMLAQGTVETSQLAAGAVTAANVQTASERISLRINSPAGLTLDSFGQVVTAVGPDRLLVGAPNDATGGSAYLFDGDGLFLRKYGNPGTSGGGQFGASAAAVGDQQVLIGAPFDSSGALFAGAAYLFSTEGALLATFLDPQPAADEYLGFAVAALGTDRVLIGATGENAGDIDSGAVHIFRTNGQWLTTIVNPAPSYGDFFGATVAAVGTDRVLVGARYGDEGAFDTGTAYLFSTNGTLLATFENPLPQPGASFATALAAVGNDRVIIGARSAALNAVGAGAAYLFSTSGSLLRTFTNTAPQTYEAFGHSVAALGTDRVLIGAIGNDTGAPDAGAAHVFHVDGTLLETVLNPEPEFSAEFGESVATTEDGIMLVGAVSPTGLSAAYVFREDTYSPGLIADGARAASITTASLADAAVTADKIGGVLHASQLPDLNAAKITAGILNAGLIPDLDATKLTTGTLDDARLSGNVALRPGGNAFTGTQTVTGGNVGIGTLAPGQLLQLGDPGIANAQGMMRFASRSGTGPSARTWDLGVPEGDQDTSGKFYSFVIDDIQRGTDPEFLIRWDTGNVGIGTTNPTAKLDVNGPYLRISGAGNEQAYLGGDGQGGDIEIGSRNAGIMTVGFWNSAAFSHMNVVGLSFTPTSDRNAKENFKHVDPAAVLAKVAALPLSEWNYKADTTARHIGPMAQDFHAAFGVGPDNKHIATVDADGVALAAIQGLNRKLEEALEQKETALAELRRQNIELLRRLESLETRLK